VKKNNQEICEIKCLPNETKSLLVQHLIDQQSSAEISNLILEIQQTFS
jgi:hypothetical protein